MDLEGLMSPADKAQALATEEKSPDAIPSDDFIEVKVYFFSEDKHLKKKIFTEEWYITAREWMDADLKDDDTVYFQVSFAT